ncbi:uncharacterized protein LOC123563792 [Mercenaria mercenaria]|uniref:uncharacterized protein LOC123563792 n=1 Tax=Mercenaria mercenaria TaxID=6596 RepID=UPI00234EE66E|nr:uncharacterized protein LOC123563792 [Mercenaria mercenaria]
MTEGGHLKSLKDSSDADFEFSCTPCGEDDIREEAFKYCPESQEYLCTTCTRHHSRQRATRSHKLLNKDEAKTDSVDANAKCRYHSDRDIEMYCGTHDMVYCTTCIATEHRSCVGVTRIEDKTKSGVQHTVIKSVLEEINNVQKRIRALNMKKQNNLDCLEKQRNSIQEKIVEVTTSLIDHIKQLERKMTNNLANDYAKMKRDLESELNVATHMIRDLDKTSELLQRVSSMDAGQQFVQMTLMKKTIKDACTLHTNSESNATTSLHFTENKDLITSVMTATTLGKVCTEAEDRKTSNPEQYKMKSKKEINVKMANDKNVCTISDVCLLPDGMIVLTDQGNNKVKRLDVYYNLKDHCDLDAIPSGICCINKNEIAVKMNNNNIQFISVASSLLKTRRISIECGGYWGMAYCDGGLWTSKCGGVNVYNTTEGLIKTIDKNQNGKAIFKTLSVQHMAVSCDTMIVTDCSDGAVCLNTDETVERELRDSRLGRTCGVCVSVDGTVFLSAYSSNNIIMFSSDGKCLGELVAGLNNPISLCYDKNKNCVIATCQSSDSIHVIELSQ